MKILSRYMKWQGQSPATSTKSIPSVAANDASYSSTDSGEMGDEEVLQKMFSASNGLDSLKLFNGDTSLHNGDHSAADLGWVSRVAFYTQDPGQIDRIFRRSGLMRDKWDEIHSSGDETYGEMTTQKALAGLTNTYSPPSAGKSAHQSDTDESQVVFKLTPIAEIMKRTFETDWLIKSVLPADTTVMIFGPAYSCKSQIAMETAFCIGTGSDYYDNSVKQGHVVYIAGEGHKGINKRFQALFQGKGQMPGNIEVSDTAMDLHSPESVESVLTAIEGIPDLRLIIVDTLHRNFSGDENTSRDFAIVMKHCDKLRNATGATIMLVHHSGHDSQTRGRGSSAMTAAMDVEYKVSKSGNKVTLHCTKMKDDQEPEDLKFDLKSVTIGQDAEGNPITAPLLEKSTTFFTVDKSAALNATDKLTLDILQQLTDESGEAVARVEWRTASIEKYTVSSDPDKAHQTKVRKFNRCVNSLLDKNSVIEDNGYFSVAGSDVTTEEMKRDD